MLALSIGFPNSAAVGVSLLMSVFGARSAVTVATSIAVGSITVSPLTLMILEASRSSSDGFAWRNIVSALLRTVSKPIVWAPLLGIAFSCAGLNVPIFASRSLGVIAAAAGGSALVLTGLVVSAQEFEVSGSTLATLFLKFLVQPAVALAVARLVGLSVEETRYVTLIGAIPCGFFWSRVWQELWLKSKAC